MIAKPATLCAAVLAALVLTGPGCQGFSSPPPMAAAPLLEQDIQRDALQDADAGEFLPAAGGAFQLGAGDALGLYVHDSYMAWARSKEPLPGHLQFADGSASHLLEASGRDQAPMLLRQDPSILLPLERVSQFH